MLSGLMFLEHVEWKGHVERHTDSQSVIDTGKRLHCKYEPNWLKQKRKGCMDETVETKGTLERKTGNLLGKGSRGQVKKKEHEG